MGCSCFGAGVLNIPLPNGLVPQAPVHTDSVTVYSTSLDPQPLADGTKLNEPVVVATEVKEQRLSAFIMGLALVGTMTGPLLVVLHTIPRGVFGGVFFVVGYGGIEGSGITQKILHLLREPRFVPSNEPLLSVSKKKIIEYLAWQALGISTTVAISQTLGAIGFPVLITAMIPLRWLYLPRRFSVHDLRVLDAPTATSDVVLASMGGRPTMPEERLEAKPAAEAGDVDASADALEKTKRDNSDNNVLMASGTSLRSAGSRTVSGEDRTAEVEAREEKESKGDFSV